MSVSECVHMPPPGGATGWLNSEPLGSAALRGHVVVVNFWTLTCINWLHQEPSSVRGRRPTGDDGLVVIGVHTREFSFERDIDRVGQATKAQAIDYPAAVDNDYAIGSAVANHYWPALYFVDADGVIRDQHFGEGRYEQSERVIQRRLGVEHDPVSVEGLGVEAEADWDHLRTPETYLGYARSAQSRHRTAPPSMSVAPTRSPSPWPSTTGPSAASGRSGVSVSWPTRPTGASPSGSTRATRTSCCLPERESRSRSACSSTATFQSPRTSSPRRPGRTSCPEETVKYYVDRLSDGEALHGSFQLYRAFDITTAQNERRNTRRLRMPALAPGGAESVGAMAADTMRPAADDVQTLVTPGIGHWLAEQAPDEMVAALTEFLNPYPEPSPRIAATLKS